MSKETTKVQRGVQSVQKPSEYQQLIAKYIPKSKTKECANFKFEVKSCVK